MSFISINYIDLNLVDILDTIGDAICVADKDMKIIGCNKPYASYYNLSIEQIIGRGPFEFYPDFKTSIFFDGVVDTLKNRNKNSLVGYSHNTGKHVITRIYPYLETCCILHIQEITDISHKIGYTSQIDKLTSLKNRSSFEYEVKALIDYKSQFGIILLDINKFNLFNESLGIEKADEILMVVASRLKNKLAHPIYRVGPNQFAITVIGEKITVLEIAANLIAKFKNEFLINSCKYEATVSCGINYIADFKISLSEHLNNLEFALSQSKKLKAKYVEYNNETIRQKDSLLVFTKIKKDIITSQFKPFYQAQYDMYSGKICGAEALVRWKHDERGILSPASFLPVIEDHGFNIDFDRYMITSVFKDLQSMLTNHPHINISINLSSSSVCDQSIIDFIAHELKKYKLPPSAITFEITENALMHDIEMSKQVIKSLRDLGVLIAIDDFGTGYSSMTYLLRYPTNFMKIDREFVKDIDTSNSLKTITSNLIRLGHSFGMYVIAEGVERIEERQMLESLGCSIMQGFYFARPLSFSDFNNLLVSTGTASLKSSIC